MTFKGSNIYNNVWAFFIFGVMGGFSNDQKTNLRRIGIKGQGVKVRVNVVQSQEEMR